MRGELPALAGLGALRDLDLDGVGVSEVEAGDAEPAGRDLLDLRPAFTAMPRRIFAAFTGVRSRTDAIHGDSQGPRRTPKPATTPGAGIAFCKNLLGSDWKQTYPDGSKRKHDAGIGYAYDSNKDAFISPQPYLSWILDDDCNWQAPILMPDDDKAYLWDEDSLTWIVTKG